MLIRSQIIQHNDHTSSDVEYYTRFVTIRSLHHPALIQVSTLVDHESLAAQFNDFKVQRMIRIIVDGKLPPLNPYFESQFFEKNF